MKNLILISVLAATSTATSAEEQRIELNNFYPLSQENFDLGDHIFHIADNKGGFEVIEGPVDGGLARCLGSGFGYQDGTNSISGICIFGEGEDTFTMRWKAGEKGAANSWEIIVGTGRYDGMTGEGIATTDIVSMYQALPLRRTHIVGTVEIPD
ncbi:hypothetical protein [Ruegeria faecimaris]|uniref:hypothetical protein n=1 Tax=Ruegeria faecimaris TaxID=686389 RepID=UPI00248F58C3|nr:hypothetical protein [Ruegeria faecimaris]